MGAQHSALKEFGKRWHSPRAVSPETPCGIGKKPLPNLSSAGKNSVNCILLLIQMADASIEEKVKNIIVEQLGVGEDQVKPEAKFIEDLGADSLDTVELVMAFEEEFDITVPDEDAEKLTSVGEVTAYIEDQSK